MAIAALLCAGCTGSRYVTPGGAMAPGALRAENAGVRSARPGESVGTVEPARPTAKFPARVAVARVQAAGYRNHAIAGYGSGEYTVVTTREVERDADVERLFKLPQVAGVAMLNRLVLPQQFSTDADLRQAAAKLQADLLLVYTFDTSFNVNDRNLGPLGVVTLGMLPINDARISTACSAALYDVRTGYVYGLAEGTASDKGLANAWNSSDVLDAARRRTEAAAFTQLTDELETMWAGVVREHGAVSLMR
jgi:hypothetical protein